MRKLNIGGNGELIDAETGELVGRRGPDGKIVTNPEPEQTSEQPVPPRTPERLPHTVPYSKYEVRPESEFTVRFCLGFRDGRVQVYSEDAYLKAPDLERHWATFRMWTYEEELSWQNQAMEFQPQTRTFVLNQGKLNELKVKRLIKAWSFEEYEPKFKLLHVDGVLSDESYAVFKGFFPAIINNILYLMNQVLENNG